MQNKIVYEQPLNERIRNLLRLEHLFWLIDCRSKELNEWDCRILLGALLEIVELLSRSDLKSELIKELERHSSILSVLTNNPAVDQYRLTKINNAICSLLEKLKDSSYQPGFQLKKDELITSFKQRMNIPGSTCNFDLPRFHQWSNQPKAKKEQNMNVWKEDLQPIKNATNITLNMIRNSTNPNSEVAESGFYQKPIESNISCQLIRVILPAISKYYPEISAGKHRFTVRFFEENSTENRPKQTKNNVEFELHCCIL